MVYVWTDTSYEAVGTMVTWVEKQHEQLGNLHPATTLYNHSAWRGLDGERINQVSGDRKCRDTD